MAPMSPPGGPLPASQSQQNQLGAQPPTAAVAACAQGHRCDGCSKIIRDARYRMSCLSHHQYLKRRPHVVLLMAMQQAQYPAAQAIDPPVLRCVRRRMSGPSAMDANAPWTGCRSAGSSHCGPRSARRRGAPRQAGRTCARRGCVIAHICGIGTCPGWQQYIMLCHYHRAHAILSITPRAVAKVVKQASCQQCCE